MLTPKQSKTLLFAIMGIALVAYVICIVTGVGTVPKY